MHGRGPLSLASEVHEFKVMAVAAFARVVGLEPGPLMFGQFAAQGEELVAGIDGAEDLAPDFLRRLHLARDLVCPFVGDVAVRATGAHTGAVGVVNRILQLDEYVVTHFMAGNAELLGIAQLEHSVEATPENDPGNKAPQRQETEAVVELSLIHI